MSYLFPNPRKPEPQTADCARLIPGTFAAGARKPPQSVKAGLSFLGGKVSAISAESPAIPPGNVFVLLVPRPLQSPAAWKWLRSTAADFAIVGLDWLVIAASLLLFPVGRVVEDAVAASTSLLGIAVLHAALITLMGYSEGLYAEGSDRRRQAQILGKSVLWATTVLALAYGLQAPWATSGLICGAGLLHFPALLARRWQWGRPGHVADDFADARNVLIVGAGRVGRRVASYLDGHPEAGRCVYGFVDDETALGDRVIGRVSDLARLARQGFVDEVILAGPRDPDLTQHVLREARRLRLDVEMVPDLFGCKPVETEAERIGDCPVICLHAECLPAFGLVLKRVLDVIGAGLALTVLSPLLAVIAGLIKVDSPGPAFYSAQRAGRKSRLFRCYKFRTMVSNADELKDCLRQNNQRSGPFFKIAGDPRITRLGHFLRRYSLDELPQLWNVLRGDMSLVGPRPHPVDDFAVYEVEHLARLDVTPGITGLWQVTARRDPSFERGMELDREYIRTWSLRSDMRILLRTFLAVVRGGGD